MAFILFNSILLVAVMGGLVCRLADSQIPSGNLFAHLGNCLWVWSMVLIGVGACGVVLPHILGIDRRPSSDTMLLAGLAMYFCTRWRRRKGDR